VRGLVFKMRCNCGNVMDLKMASKMKAEGCKVLTALTTIVTAQCNDCGNMFQVPIKSNSMISKEN
jgi:hypothetical protein